MIRAVGQWAFVEVDVSQDPYALDTIASRLYVRDGTADNRRGLAVGKLHSIGRGVWDGKRYVPRNLEIGTRVVFRGYLQELVQVFEQDKLLCAIKIEDILGVVT